MKRFVPALCLFLASCGRATQPQARDRSPLPEGSEAVAFSPNSATVRVGTATKDGLAGDADFNFVGNGTPLFVLYDPDRDDNPKRLVVAISRDGEMKGKMVRIPRENVRPR